MNSPGQQVPNMLLEISGEITPERMKGWSQSKNNRMISVCFQGKPFNIMVIQVYAPTSNTEEAEVEWFYEDLQDLLEHPKKMSFSLQGTGMQKQEVKKHLE